MAYDPMQELEKLGQPQQPQGQPPGGAAFGAMGDPGQAAGGPASFAAMSKPMPQPQGGPAPSPIQPEKPNPTPQGGPAPSPIQPGKPNPTPQGGPVPGAPMKPAPVPQGGPDLDPGAAWGQLNSQFQSKFGRAMTPQEAAALKSYAGYQDGGNVTQALLDKAQQGIGAYSGNLSNPFGAAQAPTAAGAPADPGLATNTLAQSELQKLLTTGSTSGMTLDPNNPAIQAQRSAFERRNSQQTGRERLALAERAAAGNSLGTGGFNADIAGAENARAGRSADFEGQLLGQELQSQRERVMRGIEMANSSGNAAASRALQEKLGLIDADIRKTGQKGQLGLGTLQTLLSDQRAKDALGFNYTALGANMNQNLLNSILGGL